MEDRQSHSMEETSISPSMEAANPKPFQCSWAEGCDKHEMRFVSRMQQRQLLIHGLASQSFNRKSDLQRHYRIHTNERPYACDHLNCDKTFIQRSALTVHKRTHTGDKPHKCPFSGCLKCFSDSSSLARHRRIHTNDKPYICQFTQCQKAFCRRTTMLKHCQKDHSAEFAGIGELDENSDDEGNETLEINDGSDHVDEANGASPDVETPPDEMSESSASSNLFAPGSAMPARADENNNNNHHHHNLNHNHSHSHALSKNYNANLWRLPASSAQCAGISSSTTTPSSTSGNELSSAMFSRMASLQSPMMTMSSPNRSSFPASLPNTGQINSFQNLRSNSTQHSSLDEYTAWMAANRPDQVRRDQRTVNCDHGQQLRSPKMPRQMQNLFRRSDSYHGPYNTVPQQLTTIDDVIAEGSHCPLFATSSPSFPNFRNVHPGSKDFTPKPYPGAHINQCPPQPISQMPYNPHSDHLQPNLDETLPADMSTGYGLSISPSSRNATYLGPMPVGTVPATHYPISNLKNSAMLPADLDLYKQLKADPVYGQLPEHASFNF